MLATEDRGFYEHFLGKMVRMAPCHPGVTVGQQYPSQKLPDCACWGMGVETFTRACYMPGLGTEDETERKWAVLEK